MTLLRGKAETLGHLDNKRELGKEKSGQHPTSATTQASAQLTSTTCGLTCTLTMYIIRYDVSLASVPLLGNCLNMVLICLWEET